MLLRSSIRMAHRPLQQLDFFPSERPDGAEWQVAESHGSHGHALKSLHLVAHAGQQSADFAVAAFIEHHFQDCRAFAAALDSHVLGMRKSFRQVHAAMKLCDHITLDLSGDLYLVNLFNTVARVGQPIG
jgi:hypothetical protein